MGKGVWILFSAVSIVCVLLLLALVFIFKEASEVREFDENCNELSFSPDAQKSILFLPDGFENEQDFKKQVLKKTNFINKIEPFNGVFTSYFVKEINLDLGCEINKDKAVVCDSSKIQKNAKTCPHDYVIVLSNQKDEYIRSSAYMNFVAVNTADDEIVLVHELGHVIGGLADEYVEQGRKPPKGAPNCDNSAECDKWSNEYAGYKDIGCYEGCTSAAFNRPTQNSIMRDCYSSTKFGEVSEDALTEKIGAQPTSTSSKIKNLVYVLQFSYKKGEDEAEILKLDAEKGFAPSVAPSVTDTDWFYSAKKDGKIISKAKINDPLVYFEDGKNEEGKLDGHTKELEEAIVSVIIPAVEEAEIVTIGVVENGEEKQLGEISVQEMQYLYSLPRLSFFNIVTFVSALIVIFLCYIIYYLIKRKKKTIRKGKRKKEKR